MIFIQEGGKDMYIIKRVIAFIAILLISASFGSDSWNREFIEESVTAPANEYDYSNRYVAYDSHNHPHIVYGKDKLVHKFFDGSQWQREIIDNTSGYVGASASIAIDTNDKVHISYYDETNHSLKYATNVSGKWAISFVDIAGYYTDISGRIQYVNMVGMYNSIAIDSSGYVHISYYCLDDENLKYATNSSGSWVVEVIDETDSVGKFTSLAIDSHDKVHISYYNETNGTLKYAQQYLGSWVKSVIDGNTTTDVGIFNSLALDSNDNAHISYYDRSNSNLKYITNATVSGDWNITTVDTYYKGAYSSIVVDGDDKVHISYRSGSQADLKYATNTTAGGIWSTENVLTEGNVGVSTSLALDSNKHVFIAHIEYDSSNSRRYLRYASKVSGSWIYDLIEEFESFGKYTSMAKDSHGNLHVSYSVERREDLRYATNVSGSWISTDINTTGRVGAYNDIAVDKNDKVYISFYDYSNRRLLYATNKSGSWVTHEVDSDANGLNCIAVDSNNNIHLAYTSKTDRYIKYTVIQENGIQTTTTAYKAYGLDFALDSSAKAHIAFTDIDNGYMRYMTNSSGVWEMTDLQDDFVNFVGISMVIDKMDKIHIAYSNSLSSDKTLKYITNKSGTWNSTIIESGYTRIPAIDIDGMGRIHIAYLNSNGISYASNRMGGWKMENADTSHPLAKSLSVVIDSNKIHLLYGVQDDYDDKHISKTLPTPIVSIIPYLLF
jgi:hypothetical protein